MFFQQPPDSGNWTKSKGTWIESLDDIVLLNESFQVRKNGLYNITIDGFPRQGNRYLRRKVLLSLPDAAMPYPLIHKQSVMEKAIEENHFVFSTFRDPIKCVSSYISEFIKIDKQHRILNALKNKIYTKKDYLLIEKCFLFYIRMTDFIFNNIENIYVVPFDSIKNDFENSLSIKISKIVQDKNFVFSELVEPHSSYDQRLREYLLSDKFKDICDLAYKSYNNVVYLNQKYPQKFI